jgi:hypothetical protein
LLTVVGTGTLLKYTCQVGAAFKRPTSGTYNWPP